MRRAWLVSSLLVLPFLAGRVVAQADPEPKDGKVTISLTLSPAAPPRPVSKYYLVPEYRDQQPGEKVGGFLRSLMGQSVFYDKENTEKRQKWLDMPLAELPADVREQAGIKNGIAYDPPFADKMVFIDQAARYTRIEWNEWFNIRHDGAYTLLPELQKMRDLGYVLRLRMRGEAKNREFRRAVETAKSLFGLAQTCERHPTLIANLVAMAVLAQELNGLEELVQQPGCPNLFWSFTDLPTPAVNLRYGIGGERVFLTAQFGPLLQSDRPVSDQEVSKYLKQIDEITAMAGDEPPKGPARRPSATFAAWADDKGRVEAARKRLAEYGGFSADAVKAFSPLRAVLTADLVQYEFYRDELKKWMNLSYPQAAAGLAREEERLKAAERDLLLTPRMVPAVLKVKKAQTRTDQRVAYLRTIEAVRLYAHENGGRLPAALSDIKLPLPSDPVTGKPFRYTVKEGVATLAGENPDPGNEKTNRVYEITIRK